MNTATEREMGVGEVVQIKRAVQPRKKAVQQASKEVESNRRATVGLLKLHKAEARSIGQFTAAVAAAFLPLASYILAHQEATSRPAMWALVAAALMFSAPTLADWARKWCGSATKSWGFAILLEGVLISSSSEYLSLGGLAILMAINCQSAWALYGQSTKRPAKRSK